MAGPLAGVGVRKTNVGLIILSHTFTNPENFVKIAPAAEYRPNNQLGGHADC